MGDAVEDARDSARHRRPARSRQPLCRGGLRGAALRRLDPALRQDRFPLRPRSGAPRRRRAGPLSGLRDRVPRTGERDRLRLLVLGVGGNCRAGRPVPLGRLVRRRWRGDRAHRTDPAGKPGVPDRRDPPLVLAGSWRARAGRTVAFVGVAVVLLGSWAATNLWRYDDLAVTRGRRRTCRSFAPLSSTTPSIPTTGRRPASWRTPSSVTSSASSRTARTGSTSTRSSRAGARESTRT